MVQLIVQAPLQLRDGHELTVRGKLQKDAKKFSVFFRMQSIAPYFVCFKKHAPSVVENGKEKWLYSLSPDHESENEKKATKEYSIANNTFTIIFRFIEEANSTKVRGFFDEKIDSDPNLELYNEPLEPLGTIYMIELLGDVESMDDFSLLHKPGGMSESSPTTKT